MYAIVKAGGRQLRVAPRTTVGVDRMSQAVGDGVEFTQVLAVHSGEDLTVGTPYVENAKVVGRVVAHGRDRKIRVRTYRAKKRSRRHVGHRQDHTMVQIMAIEADQIEAEAAEEPDAAPDEPVEEPEAEGTAEEPVADEAEVEDDE